MELEFYAYNFSFVRDEKNEIISDLYFYIIYSPIKKVAFVFADIADSGDVVRGNTIDEVLDKIGPSRSDKINEEFYTIQWEDIVFNYKRVDTSIHANGWYSPSSGWGIIAYPAEDKKIKLVTITKYPVFEFPDYYKITSQQSKNYERRCVVNKNRWYYFDATDTFTTYTARAVDIFSITPQGIKVVSDDGNVRIEL
jgi:hypothetical protein